MMKNNFIVLPRLRFIKLGHSKTPDGPQVLKRVLDELTPSWRKHPTLMKPIRQFIFQKDDPTTAKDRSNSWTSCRLREKIEKNLPDKERADLDLLITTIEGMRVAVQAHGLNSDQLLDDFAYRQKQLFKQRIFGASKSC